MLSFRHISIKFSKPTFHVIYPRNVKYFLLMLSISILFFLELHRCAHIPTMIFSESFCKTIFMLLLLSSLVPITHCHIRRLICRNWWLPFSLCLTKFSCFFTRPLNSSKQHSQSKCFLSDFNVTLSVLY